MARVAHHILPATVTALVVVVNAFAIGTAAAASDVASAFAAGAYDGSYFGRIKNNCKRGSKGPSFQARIENGRITGSVRHRTGTISFDEQLTGDGRVSLTGYWRGETTYSFSVKLVEGGLQVAMKLRWSRGSCGGKKILPRPWRKPSIVADAKPPAPAREVSGRATDPAPPVKAATEETPAPVEPEAMGVGEQKAVAPQLAARPETAPPKPRVELEPVEAQYLAVNTANVRAEPTVRSATITVLGRGTRVHVAGKVKGRNWYLVERDEKPLGYVFGDLLKQPEPPATQPPGAVKPAIARDETPPVITAPPSIETEEAIIEVAGTVRDQSRVVDLSLDGQPIALGADGGFNVRRGVPLGESQITLVAVDEWGNRATRQVRVSRLTRLTPTQALGIDLGRYHALVIGNDTYQNMPKLNTAVADARAVAAVLERDYDFTVDLLLNAARYDITSAISRMRRTLTERDNLLIYYAGHGVVDREAEAGFWLPVDAERDSDANWIANDYLTRNLRAMSAKHVMVVADSCYSGTLVRAAPAAVRSGRERTAWLVRMAEKKSRTAMVSGGLEPVMDAGGGGHSVFAKAFLEALSENDGVLDGQALFARIQRPVILNSEQTPGYADIRRAGHDGGDFLFARR